MHPDESDESGGDGGGFFDGGDEVLTLQVGAYSNHVGAHFWTLQHLQQQRRHQLHAAAPGERYGGRVMLEEVRGELRPRLIAFDCREDVETGMEFAGLVDEGAREAATTWGGDVSQPAPSETTKFEAPLQQVWRAVGNGEFFGDAARRRELQGALNIRAWPQLMYPPLSRQSLQLLPPSAVLDFESYASGSGEAAFSSLDMDERELYVDVLRHRLERCDALQGAMTLCDVRGGWSGLAHMQMSNFKEECSGCPIACFGFWETQKNSPRDPLETANLALTIQGLSEICSWATFIDPHVFSGSMEPNCSSAVLAVGIETVTGPFRLNGIYSGNVGKLRMRDWVGMSAGRTPFVSLGLGLKGNVGDEKHVIRDLSPRFGVGAEVRGDSRCTITRGPVEHYDGQLLDSRAPIPVPLSFPPEFGCEVECQMDGPETCSAVVTCHSGAAVRPLLDHVIQRLNLKDSPVIRALERNGVQYEDSSDLLETLVSLAERYEDY
jgi:hypothetical protein